VEVKAEVNVERGGAEKTGFPLFLLVRQPDGKGSMLYRRVQCKMCFCSTKTSCFSLRGFFHQQDESRLNNPPAFSDRPKMAIKGN
jgi:hypothetical protein